MKNKLKNLFLGQSYIDSWQDYENCLSKSKSVKWDYIILTASNEEQAKTYISQINYRLQQGYLPKSTHYAVLPDPMGKRVGSGGATFNVLKYVKEHLGGESFKGKRILVIHSGGDSKRVPQYSACGKLFSPVSRTLPDGRRSTLFDEFIVAMSGVAARIKDGMLVLSGDVLLLFNPLQIDFQFGGAAAISIKEEVATGKNHGVFLNDGTGTVKRFLHKQTVETLTSLGAVDENGEVDIDTGAVVMDSKLLEDLYSLVNTPEKFDKFVNETVRISFYADFLYPLAKESTLEDFYKETPEGDFSEDLKECRTLLWNVLRKHSLHMLSLAPARFIHFGTTRELLKLVSEDIDDYSFLGWEKQVFSSSKSKCACSNSVIEDTAFADESSYIEDSYIMGSSKIGKNCVISNVYLEDEIIEDNTVLHGLKLKNGKYVVRKYKTDTNPKENDFWNSEEFFEADSFKDSLHGKGKVKTSLCKSFNEADTLFILDWQNELEEKIRVYNLISDIKSGIYVKDAAERFGKKPSENQIKLLLDIAEKSNFSLKVRIYYYSSFLVSNNDSSCGTTKEALENQCFSTIQNSILQACLENLEFDKTLKIAKDEVITKLPVRVNFGGGWSDTPPYCNENGGTVLNAAIKLNGKLPIMVIVRKKDEFNIEFGSEDTKAHGTFTETKQIQDCSNPFDPFALHKAALVASGIIPAKEDIPLEEILKSMGGGIYLSTQVLGIPKGSGLGTSSILAGACMKAIFEFLGKDVSDDILYDRVLCMEQIMSTGGGWQDQVGGIAPGFKYITSEAGTYQQLKVENITLKEETKEELNNRFALIYTGQRRLARNLLRQVVGKYIGAHKGSLEVLSEIQRMAALMRFELEKGNIDNFAELLNSHWELSKRLDSGCTNTCIDQIIMSVDPLICGKFIAGAGGGGFIQVILKKGCTKDDLRSSLKAVFGNSGVDVWDTEFIFNE